MPSIHLYGSGAEPPRISSDEFDARLEGLRKNLAAVGYDHSEIDEWIKMLEKGHNHGWPNEMNRYFMSYLEEFTEPLPLSNGNDLRSVSTLIDSQVVMALFAEPVMTPFGPKATRSDDEGVCYWLNYLAADQLQQLTNAWSANPSRIISPLDSEVIDFVETFEDPDIGMFCILEFD